MGKKDIVFLGDSQTNGCEWHELLGMKNVKNRGISSDVIQGFIDRVDPIVEGQPAKVFILGGVNDISHDLTPDSLCTSMEKLIVKSSKGRHAPKSTCRVCCLSTTVSAATARWWARSR